MKPTTHRRGQPGFVSYLLVLTTGAILTMLMVLTYRQAHVSQEVQKSVQLRLDYSEKEDAILRSIVAITPNRAIMAMHQRANLNTSATNSLRWENIFTEALALGNARTSIPGDLLASLNVSDIRTGNTGDSALATPRVIFNALTPTSADETYVSVGVNRSLGTGFPAALTTSAATRALDLVYPIISTDKVYAALAQPILDSSKVGVSTIDYPNFNRLKYPQISFAYAKPGEGFVAKQNWWAFSLNVAAQDADRTGLTRIARPARDFVLSLYEIPSQLAISASSFMSLGAYKSGAAWSANGKVNIDGGVFAGRAQVEGSAALPALASRRSMTLKQGAKVGTITADGDSYSPFKPGTREESQMGSPTDDVFFPASLASESGRVAFVPINRGKQFFDRFDPATRQELAATAWNEYSVGALQCAMRVDIIEAEPKPSNKPTKLRFSYLGKGNTGRQIFDEPKQWGWRKVADEGGDHDFKTQVVDIAYGVLDNLLVIQEEVTGSVMFDNIRFNPDPLPMTAKFGYYRPRKPYGIQPLKSDDTSVDPLKEEKWCVVIYPQRIKEFIKFIDNDEAGNPTELNNSLVVNVDYTTTTGSVSLRPPGIAPFMLCEDYVYRVILQECANLFCTGHIDPVIKHDDCTRSFFPKGFSLVTNMLLHMGDDFNIVEVDKTLWPTGYVPAKTASNPSGNYYPPCSLFAPDKRYGVNTDPLEVNVSGQIGSLASDTAENAIRPLDSKKATGGEFTADRITVNLRAITHPCELPPITMKNWLIVLDELPRK